MPAVTGVSVSVVSVMSIRVLESYRESYLVGVVIVVCRSFSRRKLKREHFCLSKSKFISPCMVIDVLGYLVMISSMAACMSDRKVWYVCASCFGLLYMCIMVCRGLFFCFVVCICCIIVAVFRIFISVINVSCRSFFVYIDMSVSCLAV